MPLQIAPGMMVGVADNEQPSQPNQPVPYDPEQQRQFEQFQQYQQFLKFQESQGQLPPAAAQAPKGRPWWQKVLRSKLFYRLIGLAVVIGAVAWGCSFIRDTLDPGRKDDGLGVTGSAGPGRRLAPGMPNEILTTLYQSTSVGVADNACASFDTQGALAFGRNYEVNDCPAAVEKLKDAVAPLKDPPRIGIPAGQESFEVSSCDLEVQPGTLSLGRFTFKKFENGPKWIISDVRLETCATATTPTAPTTRPSN